jgi:hypothetical protein
VSTRVPCPRHECSIYRMRTLEFVAAGQGCSCSSMCASIASSEVQQPTLHSSQRVNPGMQKRIPHSSVIGANPAPVCLSQQLGRRNTSHNKLGASHYQTGTNSNEQKRELLTGDSLIQVLAFKCPGLEHRQPPSQGVHRRQEEQEACTDERNYLLNAIKTERMMHQQPSRGECTQSMATLMCSIRIPGDNRIGSLPSSIGRRRLCSLCYCAATAHSSRANRRRKKSSFDTARAAF